jgi:long-chain acyl-CoA synthetase
MTSEIVEAFQRIRVDQPDRVLVYLPASDSVWTAADLWNAAAAVSQALTRARVNPRGLIVAALGNRPVYLATFLACRMRRQSFCPLDPGTTPTEISAIAKQLGAAAVLTFDAAHPALPSIAAPDDGGGDSRHGDAAVLKMTSGSTRAPRVTLTLESALTIDSRGLMAGMAIGADDTQIAAIPLSHAYGLGNLVGPLFIQGTPVVLRDAFVPQRLPDDARRFAARAFPGVPFMFDHFVKNPPPAGWPPLLTILVSAGATLETSVADAFRRTFGVKVHPFYGTSETGGITYDATDEPAADGLVGTPLPGVRVEIVPENGAPAGSGRVLVYAASVITGYADGVDADSFTCGGFLTGDLGTIDSRGRLNLSGRVSSFVNVAGRKVQPDEVERVLRDYDGIVDVRVLGIADERRGEQLVACVVARGARPSLMTLRQFCGARLAAHKIPRAFVFLDAIPLTGRGKTDLVRLRNAVAAALNTQTGVL